MPNELPNVQWAYLIMDGDTGQGDVYGTNDLRVAQAAAAEGTNVVIHLMTCQRIVKDEGADHPEQVNIAEQTTYKFD